MKKQTKSLLSIILSAMMVISMIVLAVPANAATTDKTSTGVPTYYMWYEQGNNSNIATWTKRIQMTDNGDGTYSTTFNDIINGNLYFTINTSSTSPTQQMLTSALSITSCSAGLQNGTQGYYTEGKDFRFNYFYRQNSAITDVKITWDGSSSATIEDVSSVVETTAPTTEPTTAPTTAVPTTVEPTTVEPTTEPTTVPVPTSTWFVEGGFNGWTAANPLEQTGTENVLETTFYIPAGTYTMKILDNSSTDVWYGNGHTYTDTISNATLNTNAGSTNNITLIATGGNYTFTMNTSTHALSVSYVPLSVSASAVVPSTAYVNESFDVTINAEPDEALASMVSYYTYTASINGTYFATDVQSTNSSYTCQASSNTTGDVAVVYTVSAYDSNGVLLATSDSTSTNVVINSRPFTVDISTSAYEAILNETDVTLTAISSPTGYGSTYEFFVSSDGSTFTSLGEASASNTITLPKFTELGTWYYKVEATDIYGSSASSNEIMVTSTTNTGTHDIDVYFKTSSSYAYHPSIAINDSAAVAMTKADEIGPSYSGALTFYWYKATITIDAATNATLVFTTNRTAMHATITKTFVGNTYYFAVDDLINGREVVDLTGKPEYIRNYYHSARHMVTSSAEGDNTLGFTNIGGTVYQMGALVNGLPVLNASKTLLPVGASSFAGDFDIKSVTLMQELAICKRNVSQLQAQLLDVDLNGTVDVKDATLAQKALAGM